MKGVQAENIKTTSKGWGWGVEGGEDDEENVGRRKKKKKKKICSVCLVGFLTSLSTTRLYCGCAPRQSV